MGRLVLFFILLHPVLYAQDLNYAKEVIQNLTDIKLKGRGYVGHGDYLAAQYIASEFEKAKLIGFSNSCFQTFSMPVNTFPGAMMLQLNDKKLIPGVEFLVDPASPGIKGKFKVVNLSAQNLLDSNQWKAKVKLSRDAFVFIQSFDKTSFTKEQLKTINNIIEFLKYSVESPAVGTIQVTSEKLTWSTSPVVHAKPSVIINADALPESVNEIIVNIENKFVKNYETRNVVGYFPGKLSDSILVYTAHYDHLGMMGNKTIFPGANDNASGVALLLNLVKYFAANPPAYTTVFIAFSGEEIGLVGSQYFTEHPLIELKKIKFLLNFDMAGTGDDGIQIVNGKIYIDKFNLISKINMEMNLVKQIKPRGEACNSDHCMFYKKGVPCFFIYTLGGIQAYHDVYDRADTLPLTDFDDYFKLIVEFLKRI